MRKIKTYQTQFGYVEVQAQEFKTMSSITYWGYLNNGHLIGYSGDKSVIERRMKKYLTKRGV